MQRAVAVPPADLSVLPERDRKKITSFASRDGRYRLYACDVCERYIKAYDARQASRPVLPGVDGVATLPLDAAAMQKGYK